MPHSITQMHTVLPSPSPNLGTPEAQNSSLRPSQRLPHPHPQCLGPPRLESHNFHFTNQSSENQRTLNTILQIRKPVLPLGLQRDAYLLTAYLYLYLHLQSAIFLCTGLHFLLRVRPLHITDCKIF